MYVKKIELRNFRNHIEKKIEFDKKINLILGENAKGKTNIVEAINICSYGKSFRNAKDLELINLDNENSNIKMSYVYDEIYDVEKIIDIEIYKNQKNIIKIDNKKIKNYVQLMENFYSVVFAPEDLKIIKEDPIKRRTFIDKELCQIDKKYFLNLREYRKILKNRNNILKNEKIDSNFLDILDEQIAKRAEIIIKKREEYIKLLNNVSKDIHYKISGEKEKIYIEYQKNINGDYLNSLKNNRNNDIKYKTTGLGIHKDDIKIIINGKDSRKYASQGQQRSIILSLKIAQINIITKLKEEKPVFILDDVFSELDNNRKKALVDILQDIQIFITTTQQEEFFDKSHIIEIE
ncbi:MAG: DNA replication/repair protein RecF [Eubacteriales bacterium]|nr:DNA replication/repair protein RecF [Eubacteriales bacterium]MDY3332450.1 DNA replication/repair protein RecF [Gallibacter sp.]